MSIDITTLALAKEYTNRMVGSGGTGGGVNGKDGITPHIGDNGNWFIGTVDTGISAQGPAGENGVTPHIGTNGNWYIGSVNTGVSAKGAKGDNGLDGNGIKSAILNSDYTLTLTFDDGTTYTTPSIRGATGDAGSAGKNGTDGKDGSDGVGIASIKQTTTSTADGGNNVFTVTLTNGTTATFIVKNGSKGSTGKDGSNGVDGGHYTPVVTQPTTDTMQISFAPSKSDMPAVNPVTVNLPVSENSGQNVAQVAMDYDKNVKAVAHRGYSTEAPENTIPAYILAKRKGFGYAECDVSFTSDGVAVLLHDSTIDRTSDGSGSISSLTYAEVSRYDFGSWKSADYAGTKIPTFVEFISTCKAIGLHPYIELKSNGDYTEEQIAGIVAAVKAHGMAGKVTYISFNAVFLGYVKNADPSARLGYLANNVNFASVSDATALKTDSNEVYIGACNDNLRADGVQRCIEANLPLEIWTVNSASIIESMNPYITGVTSDSLIAGKILYEKYINYVAPAPPTLHTVTNNLTNAATSNATVNVEDGAAYTAAITPAEGYVIQNVTVVMGSIDITADAYASGAISIPAVTGNVVITVVAAAAGVTAYTITNALTNVTTSNGATTAEANAAYTAELTAKTGYVLDSVTVTMGGADITAAAYSDGVIHIAAVTGNVVITATASKPGAQPLYSWDLTKSLTDTVSGVTAVTNATQGSTGVVFDAPESGGGHYIDFGAVYVPNRTFEIDVASMALDTAAAPHARLFAVDTDTDTGSGGSGLVYHSGLKKWKFYAFGTGWMNEAANIAADAFSAKTVAIKVDANRMASVYVDGVLVLAASNPFPEYATGHAYIGGSVTDALYNVTISGFRVYEGVA